VLGDGEALADGEALVDVVVDGAGLLGGVVMLSVTVTSSKRALA
jgi:hypothetical protein